jgi:hypothetical protein
MKQKILIALVVLAIVAVAIFVLPEVANAGWAWDPICPGYCP